MHISVLGRLFAPKGTPAPVIARLNSAAMRAVQRAEIEKWWPIIKAANIKGE